MMTSYQVLQPIGTIITGSVTLGDYLEKMFFLLIGVSGVLAVVMLVVCGIKLMMSEGAGGREAAKKCIWDAVFGLLIAIGAWLLLNTINPQLVSSTLTMETVQMTTQSTAVEGSTAATAVDEPAPTAPGWYIHYQEGTSKKYRKFKPTEEAICLKILEEMKSAGFTILPGGANNVTGCFEVRSQSSAPAGTTAASGYTSGGSEASIRGSLCGESRVDGCLPRSPALQIQINKRACANIAVYESNCTSVASLPGDAVSFLQSLPGLCGCNIVITGGTEAGHKTHAANKPIFDLRLSQGDALYNAVVGGANPRPSFSGNQRWLYNGYWFTDEKSSATRHWHVCKDGTNTTYCKDCGSGNTLCPKPCGEGNPQCPRP